MKEAVFLQEVKEIQLLKNALTLLDWDSSTGMPEKSSPFRGEVELSLIHISEPTRRN